MARGRSQDDWGVRAAATALSARSAIRVPIAPQADDDCRTRLSSINASPPAGCRAALQRRCSWKAGCTGCSEPSGPYTANGGTTSLCSSSAASHSHPSVATLRRNGMSGLRPFSTVGRRSTMSTKRDMLDLLRAGRNGESGGPTPREEIVDQVGTMLSAGFITTALALFWTVLMLALFPSHQEAVRRDLRQDERRRRPSGRCCVPAGRLRPFFTRPCDFFRPPTSSRAKPKSRIGSGTS
jgi:hypothetical protein